MNSRDDTLDAALRQLREASNPSADERSRTFAAAQRLGESPITPAPERALRPGLAATVGAGQGSRVTRELLAWGFALGLASLGIGVGIGIGLGRGSVVVPPEPDPTPVQAAPAAAPAPLLDATESRGGPERLEPVPPARAVQPKPRSKPRARPGAALVERAARSPLSLAEALQLLSRAERAIYSDNAAWAISLLDELDERAPRALLRDERIATRILAWCADGQVENAERLARQAREEAPTSIYGAILERACNGESALPPAALPRVDSPRP